MKFFKNKKVLITGGAGFIGSHLAKRLLAYNAKVTVVVKYKSIIDSPRLTKVWDKINVIEADLRNILELQFGKHTVSNRPRRIWLKLYSRLELSLN